MRSLVLRRVFACAGMLCVLLIIALAGLFTTVPTVQAQGGDPDGDLLQRAVLYLADQLKTEIRVIDGYSYAPETFGDGSLGCPQPGVSYMQAIVEGYKYTITYQQKTYDVRMSKDGSMILLCGTGNSAPLPVGLTSYRGKQFGIAYPSVWTITERPTDVLFAPGSVPACAQPGMLITPLGTVTEKQTPDSLIDTFITTLGPKAALDPGARIDLKNGRSALYTTVCADNSTRQGRVSIITVNGSAFRIVQYAPQAEFTAWADAYLKVLGQFTITIAGSGVPDGENAEAVSLPTTAIPAAIYHVFAGGVYRGTLNDLPGLPIAAGALEARGYRNISPSPDGRFVAYHDPNTRTLYVAQPGQSIPPVAIGQSSDVVAAYPPIWKSARELIFAQTDGFYQVDLSIGLTATRLTAVDLSADACLLSATSDEISPEVALYEQETGLNGARAFLSHLPAADEILYSDCAGVGLTGSKSGIINAAITRMSISPDRSKVIGQVENQLSIVDLSTTSIDPLTTVAPFDQAVYSADGKSVYYSVLTLKDTITLDASYDEERLKQTFGAFPVKVQINTITLHRIDLTTGIDSELFTGEGYAIGRIAPSPDGSGVLFSLIPDARLFAQAFGGNATENELRRQAPKTQVYWLPFGSDGSAGRPIVVGITSQIVWGALGSAPLPTPTGGYTPSAAATVTPPPILFASNTPLATATPTRRVRTPPPTNTQSTP